MTQNEELTEQERTWGLLYDQISHVLHQFGTEDHFGHADYLLVDDNYGWKRHTIEIHKLHMLRPAVVHSLQPLLQGLLGWEVVIAVDMPGTEGKWPPMGVIIRSDAIVDKLQRQHLPAEFQNIRY
jgi:hypothetical protein